MPVTTSKNKITRFSASDRQPVRMRFTKKNISSIQWRFLQFSDEARRWLNLRKRNELLRKSENMLSMVSELAFGTDISVESDALDAEFLAEIGN